MNVNDPKIPEQHLPTDAFIQHCIDEARARLPAGEVAMTEQLLPFARIVMLGSLLLKAKRLLEKQP